MGRVKKKSGRKKGGRREEVNDRRKRSTTSKVNCQSLAVNAEKFMDNVVSRPRSGVSITFSR